MDITSCASIAMKVRGVHVDLLRGGESRAGGWTHGHVAWWGVVGVAAAREGVREGRHAT